ncbi:MAG: universal stress protein [Terriglobia bacterium]
MTKFAPRRILCPVDFSEQSVAALRVAGNMARIFDAEVLVLHAQQFDAPVYFTAAQVQSLKAQLRRSLRSAREYLEEFVRINLPRGVSRSIRVAEHDPVEAILAMDREWRPDLLVMGTHGRTGWTRIRLGSVMESIFRQMRGPLITVGPKVKAVGRGPLRRIVSPVDLNDISRGTFQYSLALAERTKAEVIALHVLEPTVEPGRNGDVKELCDWVSPEARAHCSVHELVRSGTPADRIVAEAKSARADLIVLGAQPRSYLGGLVFGSTTEAVVRTAPCPVMSIIYPRGRKSSS